MLTCRDETSFVGYLSWRQAGRRRVVRTCTGGGSHVFGWLCQPYAQQQCGIRRACSLCLSTTVKMHVALPYAPLTAVVYPSLFSHLSSFHLRFPQLEVPLFLTLDPPPPAPAFSLVNTSRQARHLVGGALRGAAAEHSQRTPSPVHILRPVAGLLQRGGRCVLLLTRRQHERERPCCQIVN